MGPQREEARGTWRGGSSTATGRPQHRNGRGRIAVREGPATQSGGGGRSSLVTGGPQYSNGGAAVGEVLQRSNGGLRYGAGSRLAAPTREAQWHAAQNFCQFWKGGLE